MKAKIEVSLVEIYYGMFRYQVSMGLHWRIWGGACWAHAPPRGPNSFIFAYIFAEKHPRRRSTPPQRVHIPPTVNPGSAIGTVTLILKISANGVEL